VFFISNAYAQTADAAANPGVMGYVQTYGIFIIMLVVMYFLMIRPQQKRQKELRTLMDALAKGDEVITVGGVLGRVTKVTDAYVTIEISAGNEMVVQKNAVTALLPKGTLKSL
jgi:preprotein translocase subunit YajC